jgi:hypothetical protein
VQKVESIDTSGLVVEVEVSRNLLFVASGYPDEVAIYDVTNSRAPTLIGQLTPGGHVADMRVVGHRLHVALHEGFLSWVKCLAGLYCARGKDVQVFDISDPASPVELGSYDGEHHPAIDMAAHDGGHAVVRQKQGFVVYEAVSVGE